MQTACSISKQSRLIAAFSLLFFVLYCSVGVCTNLFASSSSDSSSAGSSSTVSVTMNTATAGTAHVDHSMHMGMSSDQSAGQVSLAHCDGQPKNCDWSLNPVVDPVADATPDMTFFLQYLLSGVVLLFSILLAISLKLSYSYSFVRERCRFSGVPRLHLQKAVFLN